MQYAPIVTARELSFQLIQRCRHLAEANLQHFAHKGCQIRPPIAHLLPVVEVLQAFAVAQIDDLRVALR